MVEACLVSHGEICWAIADWNRHEPAHEDDGWRSLKGESEEGFLLTARLIPAPNNRNITNTINHHNALIYAYEDFYCFSVAPLSNKFCTPAGVKIPAAVLKSYSALTRS